MADLLKVIDEPAAISDLGPVLRAEYLERHDCLPFHLLSAETFEICVFLLLLREHPGERIYYYGKTGDRGRDIVWHHANGQIEFVQCKRYGSSIGVREVRQELAKLCVNMFQGRLPEKPDRISFYVVPDLSSDAQDLLVTQEHWKVFAPKALEEHLGKKPPSSLLTYAREWWPTLDRVTEVALSERAHHHPDLVEKFFAVRKVIDGSVADLVPLLNDIRDNIRAIPSGSVPSVAGFRAPSKEPVSFRIHSVAPSVGPKLLGRVRDLEQIKLLLKAAVESNSGVAALHGVPGVGKSTIMGHLAHDQTLGKLFPDGGLWTAVGRTPDTIDLLRIWGRGLKIPAAKMIRLDEALGAIRQLLQGKQLLILVDDVWTDAQAASFDVGGTGSVTLYSTRLPLLGQRLASSPELVYALPGLDQPEAMQLLAAHAPSVVHDYPHQCAEFVSHIQGLPLAIVVAGKMLQREHSHGEDVIHLLESIRDDARILLNQPAPASLSDLLNQTTPDVAAVLRRSTNGLDAAQRWCFARLGGFSPAPATFDAKFAAHCWKMSADDAKRLARQFVDLGLLEIPRRGQFQIHPLMHALALHEWESIHD